MRVAIFTSTPRGSISQAVIGACKSGQLSRVEVALVIASNKNAGGLRWAQDAGIPTKVIRSRGKEPEVFGEEIIGECEARGIDLIGQYGWMAKTPANVIDRFQGPSGVMMIGAHPGPLDTGRPDFGGEDMYGLRVHCARLYFVRETNRSFWTAATAQRVDYEYDKGEMLNFEHLDILPDDTPQSLAERLRPVEHSVQIQTLKDFSEGGLTTKTRAGPLVLPGEEPILEEVKRIAKEQFPRG